MSISTIQELIDLPIGEVIEVRDRRGTAEWTRQGTGFVKDDVTVAVDNFTGAITAGYVTRRGDAPFEPGQMVAQTNYNDRRYRYLLLSATDGVWATMRFRYDTFSSWQTLPDADLHTGSFERIAANERPDWWQLVFTLGRDLRSYTERVSALEAEVTRLSNEVVPPPLPPTYPDDFVSGLHALFDDFDDDDDRERVNNFLSGFGIARLDTHASDVRVWGTYEYALPNTPDLDGVSVIDVGTATVDWTLNVEVTNEGVGCTCDDVTYEQVSALVPEWVRSAGFEWEVNDCG